MLRSICKEINWIQYPINFLFRMEKLVDQQDFSVRDRKKLNKLLGQQLKKNTIDYNKIVPEFPGKSMETLKAKVAVLMKTKKVKEPITTILPNEPY